MQVLKVGGNELDDPLFIKTLASAVFAMNEPVIIVHGGGKAIADMQTRLGLQPAKVDGLRITDSESLVVSQMVLSGHVNKAIVAALIAAGVRAVGLSGVDGGLLRCVKKEHPSADLGLVGQVTEVNTQIITTLVDQGITPVISPISLGFDGQIYNVNADEVAGAVAAALQAEILSFISNVPGVLGPDRKPIPWLTANETEQLIQSGVIRDGMIPKVLAALGVINQGVASARIVNLNGLKAGGGTIFRETE